ncbi:MAG: hypothetical protein K0R38_5659 [Polyangiaceae bacterium]|jgi:hypothetical protein|nr:hypothetical protein [Polyangiaceae bacterium]
MLNHFFKGQWAFAISALGLVPPYCDHWPEWGGGNGSGGSQSSAGQAAAGDASAGDAAGGAAGAPSTPDRVVEPLLGCADPEASASAPGEFEVLPLPSDVPFTNAQWIRDWSGDGRTAVGWYPTPGVRYDYQTTTILRWTTGEGFSILEQRNVAGTYQVETPTAVASCDASIIALRHGDGTLELRGRGYVPEEGPHFHNYVTLSEDGSSVSFLSALPEFPRPWTAWYGPNGASDSLIIDPVRSLSWDGKVAFGVGCFPVDDCPGNHVFRWEPGVGGKVQTEAPTPLVAADGLSIVYDHTVTKLGIWRAEGTQVIDCGKRCHALAWSSRAQVLLLTLEGEYTLWTAVHGFRPLATLLNLPPGWRVLPTFLSLDGRTVTGTATNDEATFPYFRATLVAEALR